MPTIRQQIIDLLCQGEYGAREISQQLGIREKEVYVHLPHVACTLNARDLCLEVLPSECLSCGYVFSKRKRFNKPGRCCHCRNERVTEPRFQVKIKKMS
jgi:transcriptional regulator